MAEKRVEAPDGAVTIKLDRRHFRSGGELIAEGEKRAKAEAGSRRLVGTMGVKADGEMMTLTFPMVKER